MRRDYERHSLVNITVDLGVHEGMIEFMSVNYMDGKGMENDV